MIWRRADDWYRRRRSLALLPKRIGDRLIWLEYYDWRYVRWDAGGEPFGLRPAWRREYRLRDGYIALRQTNCVGPHGVPLSRWISPCA